MIYLYKDQYCRITRFGDSSALYSATRFVNINIDNLQDSGKEFWVMSFDLAFPVHVATTRVKEFSPVQ